MGLIINYCIINFHLLFIAPTRTVSLTFANNIANGIKPTFSWVYNRKKKIITGYKKKFEVIDRV